MIPIAIPQDIEWTLAENNQTNATIENGMLTVAAGQVPDASYADVILEAYSPSIDKTAKNVVLKAEQQPVLKSIKATMNETSFCVWMKMPNWQTISVQSDMTSTAEKCRA